MKMMTCREACEALGAACRLRPNQLKRACLEGKYPYMKVGNRVMVDVDRLRPMMEAATDDDLLSTAELSVRTGLSASSIRRAVSDGWMPCRMVGRYMRFDLTEVENAIAERMIRKYDT